MVAQVFRGELVKLAVEIGHASRAGRSAEEALAESFRRSRSARVRRGTRAVEVELHARRYHHLHGEDFSPKALLDRERETERELSMTLRDGEVETELYIKGKAESAEEAGEIEQKDGGEYRLLTAGSRSGAATLYFYGSDLRLHVDVHCVLLYRSIEYHNNDDGSGFCVLLQTSIICCHIIGDPPINESEFSLR